jgi:hypothetical protein
MEGREKRLQRDENPLGAYFRGTFWKTLFINPPEIQGLLVRLVVSA